MNCTPIGRPSAQCSGTDIDGWPVAFHNGVLGMTSREPAATARTAARATLRPGSRLTRDMARISRGDGSNSPVFHGGRATVDSTKMS